MSLNEREPMSALSNSIHVDTTTGKRSYQMTDQGALATLTDVIGGTAGGYASYAAKASNAAAVAQATNTTSETIKAAEIALATAKTARNFALGGTAALSLLQSGAEFDSRGRYTGNWSLEGARGDSALLNTVISAISAEAVGAMGLKQGTLPNNLMKSVISTGLHTTIQYQKMMAGQSNNSSTDTTSDLSRAGELFTTMYQATKEANKTDQNQRASDVIAGAGVFGRRDENGNLIFDSATGDYVNINQPIGQIGNTGSVGPVPTNENPYYGTHMHFELRINNERVNSETFNWNEYHEHGLTYVNQYMRTFNTNDAWRTR